MNIMRIDVRPQKCYVCAEPPAEVEASLRCQDCDVFIARETEVERLREHPELLPKPPEWWDW